MNERWQIDNSNLTFSTFAWEVFEMLSEMKNAGVYWIFYVYDFTSILVNMSGQIYQYTRLHIQVRLGNKHNNLVKLLLVVPLC